MGKMTKLFPFFFFNLENLVHVTTKTHKAVWWCTPLMLALWEQRLADLCGFEFQASPSYTET